MKKILLFALPLLAMIAMSCEKDNGTEPELSGDDIIEFKDPKFLKALLTVQKIDIYDEEKGDYILHTIDVDANKDGKISVNEAQKVKGLRLCNKSFKIKEIPKIKYFTSLKSLSCYSNLLTSLDVSKNTTLTDLNCGGNKLTKIILPADHSLNNYSIQHITSEYGNIIEYR